MPKSNRTRHLILTRVHSDSLRREIYFLFFPQNAAGFVYLDILHVYVTIMNSLQHVSGFTCNGCAIACKYCELTALTLQPVLILELLNGFEFTFRNGATTSIKCYTNFTLFLKNIAQVNFALNLLRID